MPKILEKYKLVDINTALLNIHCPHKNESQDELINSENINKRRLIFEELLAHQLIFKRIKALNKRLISFKLDDNKKPIEKL